MRKLTSSVVKMVVCAVVCVVSASSLANDDGYTWSLINNGELVVSSTEDHEGNLDLCDPSVIEVPSWVPLAQRPDPSAKFYMYYGEHHGYFIRMKWASAITGPWTEYQPEPHGEDVSEDDRALGRSGVMDFLADTARNRAHPDNAHLTNTDFVEDWIDSKNGNAGHLSSPSVWIDEANRVFCMAFHGQISASDADAADAGIEGTDLDHSHSAGYVAFSKYGKNFNDPRTGGGDNGVWTDKFGNERPYGPLERDGGITAQICPNEYPRMVTVRGKLYVVGTHGYINAHVRHEDPWQERRDTDQYRPAWVRVSNNSNEDNIIEGFFGSAEFAGHPNNPVGAAIQNGANNWKVNHVGVAYLPEDKRIEVYIYIRNDRGDKFNQTMRVEIDASSDNPVDWALARYSSGPNRGEVVLDVVCTPEAIKAAVIAANGAGVDAKEYALPVSMGTPGVITTGGRKFAFVGFSKSEITDQFPHSEGQIACIELFAGNNTTPDTTPPSPSPSTWAQVPQAQNATSITMQATTASDPSGGVQYKFRNVTLNEETTWQASRAFTATGLDPDTTYEFMVKTRDAKGNEGEFSVSKSATTLTADALTISGTISGPAKEGVKIELSGPDSKETTTDADGNYSFVVTAGSYTVIPSLDGYTFDPASLPANVSDESVLGVDFTSEGVGGPDTAPPTPNPSTWAQVPQAISATEIRMEATLATDPSGGVQYKFHNATLGTYTDWQDSPVFIATGLEPDTEYEFRVRSRDALDHKGIYSAKESATTLEDGGPGIDEEPPSPSPSTWAQVPQAQSATSITMRATLASDPSGGVQYKFLNVTLTEESEWQSSPVFTATGLDPETEYEFRVQTRDARGNSGIYSAKASATTLEDGGPGTDEEPPTPNPSTWAQVPQAQSATSITMRATTASDSSGGVQYKFLNVTLTEESEWQSSPAFTATGLDPETEYEFRVQTRDARGNAGTYSAKASATTLARAAGTFSISGTISGDVLADVTVSLAGTSHATTTDAEGDYTLYDVENGNYIVVAELDGYTFTESQSVRVAGADIPNVDFVAFEDTTPGTVGSNSDREEEDGGCGCSTTGSSAGTAWLMLLTILGLIVSRKVVCVDSSLINS